MQVLDNLKDLGNNFKEINFSEVQNKFLESNIGKVVNFAIDEGLKYVLPDFVEDEVIEVKNTLVSEGLNKAVDKAIEKAIDLGKTTIGIFSGNFENIIQAQNAIKEGGIIDSISDAIDDILKSLTKSKKIPNTVAKLIKSGKKEILNNIEKNIKNEFLSENKSLNNLEKYIENWKKYYSDKNLSGIKKEFKKIEKEEKSILPIKNIIENINMIKNIHSIINNNPNFDFDSIYLELSKKLN